MSKLLTLCIIQQGDQVLLGMKKRGFGQGRWNGFGGKVHEGESVVEATKRELLEETGITALDLIPAGNLLFIYQDSGEDMAVTLFKVTKFSGEITESEEMKPQWFDINKIPFAQMWPDDAHWFPLFLAGKKFKGEFNFKDVNTLIDYKIDVIPVCPPMADASGSLKATRVMSSNQDLIQRLEENGVLRLPQIKQALERFPRERFVPRELKDAAYEDRPLPIGEGPATSAGRQTISQPYTVVFMLEELAVEAGDKVLEIGAGSGWQTALLSHLVGASGHIWAYEINREVGQFGKKNLAQFKLKNADYAIADASRRWSEHAPYDRIISGAAFDAIPDELRQLLKVGGCLVAPTQEQDVRVIERMSQDQFDERVYPGFVFVPVVHG